MSHRSISSIKAHDVLLYIDEAEKYILDLIDIILLNYNENSNQGPNEIALLFNGLRTRGIFLDLAGKLSLFGHSKNASIAQSINHEHFNNLTQFTNDGDTCIPSHLNSKSINDEFPLTTILEQAMGYKTETPEVSINMNTRPSIDTLFSSPFKNPTNYTEMGLMKEEINNVSINNIPEFEPNSSVNSQQTGDIKSKNKRLLNEVCGWTNSSPVIFPSSEHNTELNKIDTNELLVLHKLKINEPAKKKVKIETPQKVIPLCLQDALEPKLVTKSPQRKDTLEESKLEELIKETNKLAKDANVDFTCDVATPNDIKLFYSQKIEHLKICMKFIKSSKNQTNGIQWELIQNRIKSKLIQIEFDQISGRLEKITAKRNGYQSYFLFLFEYPMLITNGEKSRNELVFKQVYCSKICQNLKVSKAMTAWIIRRSQSLSRTKVRLALKKNRMPLDSIFLFGKRDYTQVFFNLTLMVHAFSETLRSLLIEINKTKATTITDLNNGSKMPLTSDGVKLELQKQLQLIYQCQTGFSQSPKIASLNILTDAFVDIFSNI